MFALTPTILQDLMIFEIAAVCATIVLGWPYIKRLLNYLYKALRLITTQVTCLVILASFIVKKLQQLSSTLQQLQFALPSRAREPTTLWLIWFGLLSVTLVWGVIRSLDGGHTRAPAKQRVSFINQVTDTELPAQQAVKNLQTDLRIVEDNIKTLAVAAQQLRKSTGLRWATRNHSHDGPTCLYLRARCSRH